MKLVDILPLDEWVKLETEMHNRSGLDASIFDTEGIRIAPGKNWVNRLCPEIKATDKGQSFICAVAHQNLAAQAQQTRKSVIEECDAGMIKMVVPIFVKDEFLGTASACGLLLKGGETDSFLVNKITEIEEERVEALSGDIGSISRKDLESLERFTSEKIDGIVRDYESKPTN